MLARKSAKSLSVGITTLIILVCGCLLCSLAARAASRGIVRVKTKDHQTVKLYDDYQALVIGVGDYSHWPKLPGAVRDAQEVKAALEKLGFKVELVKNPDSSQMQTLLRGLPYGLGAKKDRGLLIYFAGHGATETMADGSKLGYLVPADCPSSQRDPAGFAAKAISMGEIEDLARRVKSRHVLMVFDSCFSGSLFALSRAEPEYITAKVAKPARQFITAGDENEQVPDQSMFKQVFMDGIGGEADSDRDGYVTGRELGMYLQNKVVQYTRSAQHPQFGSINNPKLDKGDFVIQLAGGPGPQEQEEELRRERERLARERQRLEQERRQVQEEQKREAERQRLAEENRKLEEERRRLERVRQKAEQEKREREAKKPAPAPSGESKKFTNNIGMEFVLIPAGSFMMGSPASEEERDSDETQRKVTISKPFYLQTTEVTQSQWQAVMGSNPSHFKGGNNPVERVSWNDAQEFIKRLNWKEGTNKYRLPTEAQWEYACRAGSDAAYSFGDDKGRLGDYAWYWGNSGGKTHAAGGKRPNRFGLYDMHGNVWEWCTDRYGDYASGSVTDPEGAPGGSVRVDRGGSWGSNPDHLRSANRDWDFPDNRDGNIGFRVARDY